ncbi:MAG: tail fiber domain-containing protein [Chloroflexi bacterium]|nr:tail fiber domain-containing protein [Chloroflexota bacterium]
MESTIHYRPNPRYHADGINVYFGSSQDSRLVYDGANNEWTVQSKDVGGTQTDRLKVDANVDVTRAELYNDDPGATGIRLDAWHESASPAASDVLLELRVYGEDAGSTKTQYGGLKFTLTDPTDTTEDGKATLQVMTAGTLRDIDTPAVTANDTFVVLALAQTLTNKTLTTPTISGTGFTNAQHAHAAANSGGQVGAGDLSGATLAAGVTGSSLTSLGTLVSLTMGGAVNAANNAINNVGNANSDWTDGTMAVAGAGAAKTTLLRVDGYTAGGGDWPTLEFRRSRNSTMGSHTAITSDYTLGAIDFYGSDGSAFQIGARIQALGSELWSGSQRGNRLQFHTTDVTTMVEQLRIEQDGGIFMYSLLAAAASTDVNVNGSNELHSVTSSRVYKENERPLEVDSSLLYQLPIKTFDWAANSGSPGMKDFGLIAEDVVGVLPELVNLRKDRTTIANSDGTATVVETGVAKPYSIRNSMLAMLMLDQLQKINARLTAVGG